MPVLTAAHESKKHKWPLDGWPKRFSAYRFRCIDRGGYFGKKGSTYKEIPKSGRVHEAVRKLAWNCRNLEDELRALYGSHIRLKFRSAWRPIEYNRKVGSKDTSQHPKGTAVDLECPGVPTKKLHATILRGIKEGWLDQGGVGLYVKKGFVHYDHRGKPARWGKKKK